MHVNGGVGRRFDWVGGLGVSPDGGLIGWEGWV